MFHITGSGSFDKTTAWLRKLQRLPLEKIVEAPARRGMLALQQATPKDSSRAANSWGYEIKKTASSLTITWTNSDIENGFPVVLMLQFGHGTGTGGYVRGRDFINPAIVPIFNEIEEAVRKAVISA